MSGIDLTWAVCAVVAAAAASGAVGAAMQRRAALNHALLLLFAFALAGMAARQAGQFHDEPPVVVAGYAEGDRP